MEDAGDNASSAVTESAASGQDCGAVVAVDHLKPHLDGAELSASRDGKDPNQQVSAGAGEAASSSNDVKWENVEKAKNSLEVTKKMFKQGLQLAEYSKVVDTLDQVCVILKKELGEFHRDTLDALFYYGCVLLESYQEGSSLMSTNANQVVRQFAAELMEAQESLREVTDGMNGEANQDVDGEGDDDEDGDDPESQSDGESLPGPEAQNGSSSDVANMADVSETENGAPAETSTMSNGSSTDKQADPSGAAAFEGEVQLNGDSKNDGEQAMDAEEGDAVAITELKYAYEVMETVRVGYDKLMKEGRATHQDKLRLCEIHYKLALCCAENGQQSEAILEAERAVRLCEQICTLTDRDLAEAYFNLGTINNMYTLLTDAASNFEKAIAVLEARKAENEKRLEELRANPSADAKELETMTIDQKEISELIPDLMKRLEEVLEDTNMPANEAKSILKQWKDGVIDEKREGEGLPKLADAPVNDISSMVRRKRPSDVGGDEASKKLRVPDGSAQASNGHVNGVVDKSAMDSVPEVCPEVGSEPFSGSAVSAQFFGRKSKGEFDGTATISLELLEYGAAVKSQRKNKISSQSVNLITAIRRWK